MPSGTRKKNTDIAVKPNPARGQVHRHHRTHVELPPDLDGEGVVGKLALQRLRCAAKVGAQGIDEGHDAAVGVDDLGNETLLRRGPDDRKARTVGFEILAFQHAEASAPGDLEKSHQGVVLELAAAVVDPGVAKVELAASRTADEQTGEFARFVQRFHEEGLGRRQTVEQHVGKGVAVVDVDVHVERLDAPHEAGDAILGAFLDFAPAQVFTAEGHRYHLGASHQGGVETLQDDPVPTLAGAAIERAVIPAAQFAGG